MSASTVDFELVRITPMHCMYAVNPEHAVVGFTPVQVVGYLGETLRELHALGWKPGAIVAIELDTCGRVLSARLNTLH